MNYLYRTDVKIGSENIYTSLSPDNTILYITALSAATDDAVICMWELTEQQISVFTSAQGTKTQFILPVTNTELFALTLHGVEEVPVFRKLFLSSGSISWGKQPLCPDPDGCDVGPSSAILSSNVLYTWSSVGKELQRGFRGVLAMLDQNTGEAIGKLTFF